MKGVILAGGLGTRLSPLTKITNKHLLPIYDRPMILFPIETLRESGISEILIVCGKEYAGDFMTFLGSGKEWGVHLSYAIQDKNNGGIADALSYAEAFSSKGTIAVCLGDNIFSENFSDAVNSFSNGANIFLKEVNDPERFGVPVFSEDKTKIVCIEEKPEDPKSKYAQVGFFLFDNSIFKRIRSLVPSTRGELEITDAVNSYIKESSLSHSFLKEDWFDAGTFDSLLKTAEWFSQRLKNK